MPRQPRVAGDVASGPHAPHTLYPDSFLTHNLRARRRQLLQDAVGDMRATFETDAAVVEGGPEDHELEAVDADDTQRASGAAAGSTAGLMGVAAQSDSSRNGSHSPPPRSHDPAGTAGGAAGDRQQGEGEGWARGGSMRAGGEVQDDQDDTEGGVGAEGDAAGGLDGDGDDEGEGDGSGEVVEGAGDARSLGGGRVNRGRATPKRSIQRDVADGREAVLSRRVEVAGERSRGACTCVHVRLCVCGLCAKLGALV